MDVVVSSFAWTTGGADGRGACYLLVDHNVYIGETVDSAG